MAIAVAGASLSWRTTRAEDDDRLPWSPSMAWDGSGYGVVWNLGWSRRQVVFARFDSSGNRVTEPVLLASGGTFCSTPGVAWDGQRYAVAWTEPEGQGARVVLQFVGAKGTAEGEPLHIASPSPGSARVVWTGQHYELAWLSRRLDMDVFAVSVSRKGEQLGSPRRLARTAVDYEFSELSYVPHRDELVLAWTGIERGGGQWWGTVHLLRAAAGASAGRLQQVSRVHRNFCLGAVIASDGERVGVLWKEGGVVAFTAVADDGTASPRAAVGRSADDYVTLAWTGRWFGAVWTPYKSGAPTEFRFRRIGSDGSMPDEAHVVAEGPIWFPKLVWNGSQLALSHVRGSWPDTRVVITHLSSEGRGTTWGVDAATTPEASTSLPPAGGGRPRAPPGAP